MPQQSGSGYFNFLSRLRPDSIKTENSESPTVARRTSKNYGRFIGRYFGCGLDADPAFVRRRGFMVPDESIKIARVRSVSCSNMGMTIVVNTEDFRHRPEKVEHFELHEFQGGPEAFCLWLEKSFNRGSRFSYAMNARKQAFVLHMLRSTRLESSGELNPLLKALEYAEVENLQNAKRVIEEGQPLRKRK